MYSFELLEAGCYYLVQETPDSPLTMIRVNVESDHCMYISTYGDGETVAWKKKTDPIYDIVELLSDNVIKQWESLYNNNEDAYYEDED
ncbi:MAG TPA: hypothetical protein VJ647_05000 [Chitinophagaceae bacterium]|nr:hypothetical protein [Chitinophagaceae bacterium]